jgi:hypothetical protein
MTILSSMRLRPQKLFAQQDFGPTVGNEVFEGCHALKSMTFVEADGVGVEVRCRDPKVAGGADAGVFLEPSEDAFSEPLPLIGGPYAEKL